jgi:DNA-binding NtrC family response regulator
VIALADFFLTSFCNKIGRAKPNLSLSAKRRLVTHDWPGNVRELRNVIERIAYLTTEETIEESQIDFVRSPRGDTARSDDSIDLSQTLADATAGFQIRYIEQQIKAAQRNITQAAERMGLQRSNLYRKMKQLGMKSPDGES